MREPIKCPLCGVQLIVVTEESAVRLEYNHEEWRRLCKHRDVDSCAACPQMIERLRAIMRKRGGNGQSGS
jgi:hypothetical protein